MGKKNKKKHVVEDVVEPSSTHPKEEQSIEETKLAPVEAQTIPSIEAHVDQSITKQEAEASPIEVQSTTQEEAKSTPVEVQSIPHIEEEAKSAPIEVQSIPHIEEETKPAPVEQTMSPSEATPAQQQQHSLAEEKPSAWDKLRAWFRKL